MTDFALKCFGKLSILDCRGRVDGASATETIDSGSIPFQSQTKDYKNWYS